MSPPQELSCCSRLVMGCRRLDNHARLRAIAHSWLRFESTVPMRIVIAVIVSVVFVTTASAQPVPLAPAPPPSPKSLGLPESTSPMFGFFQGVDTKAKKVKLAFIDSMPEVTEKKVKRNGVDEIEYEQTYKPIVMANGVPMDDITFYNTQGQKLTRDSVLAILKVGDTLVCSGDDKPIPAAYLKVLKADAIVAVFPIDAFIEPLLQDVFPPPPGEAPLPQLGPAAPTLPAPRAK
jgi:hypothetical protein